MRKSAALICAILLILSCLFGCTRAPAKAEGDGEIHTEFEGIYLSLSSISDDEKGNKALSVRWNNETGHEAIYGEAFYIERYSNGLWIDASEYEHSYIAIACILKAHSSNDKTYSAEGFDLSREGRYRLRTEFSADGDSYSTWIEFDITKE